MLSKLQAHWASWTVRWQVFIGTLAGVLTQVQDYVPDIKANLTGKYLLAFIVANAVITYWLRIRNMPAAGAQK